MQEVGRMSNTEQFKRYIMQIECEGTLILNKESCLTIIRRCQRWLNDVENYMWNRVGSLSFDQWVEHRKDMDELNKLCQDYLQRVEKQFK